MGKKVVAICGGSNGSHTLVADLGSRDDYEVRLITRRPEIWAEKIHCTEQRALADFFPVDPTPTWWIEYEGGADKVYDWDHAAEALEGAHIAIMVCPVSAHEEILSQIVNNLPEHPLLVGTLYGQGGFDWIARKLLHNHPRASFVTIFAFKHYPFLCKAMEYGKKVTLFGRYPDLRVAVSPNKPRNTAAVTMYLGDIFRKRVSVISDFIVTTLGGTNQVLHPAINASIFKGFKMGDVVYEKQKMFYAEVNLESADVMYDLFFTEIPTIVWALDAAMKRNGSLRAQLSYDWASALLGKLPTFAQPKAIMNHVIKYIMRNHIRLKRVKAPMVPGETKEGKKGLVPAVTSRFWYDDVPHGLCVLFGIAELLEIEVPSCLKLIRINQDFMGKEYVKEIPDAKGSLLCGQHAAETSAPQAYGVYTLEDFLDFVKWDRDSETPPIEIFARQKSRL